MDFTTWFTAWLKRHPLKEPVAQHQAPYTAEVMAQVRAEGRPAPAASPVRWWLSWPRLAVTFATVAAGMVIAFVTLQTVNGPGPRFSEAEFTAEIQLLAELGEAVTDPWLEDEMEAMDLLVLAEAPQDDELWIEETLELLEQLDEAWPGDATGGALDDDWFDEFYLLDEHELAASS